MDHAVTSDETRLDTLHSHLDWSRLKRTSDYYVRGLYREIAAKNLFLWAQAIAFKVLVTIVPIVILATGIAGRMLRGSDAFATVARFIHDFLPPSQSNQLITFLNQLQQASGTIVGLGGIGLFLSAVSLFITLRVAVSNAFEQDWHEGRSVLGGYLFDVRMVIQVGALFLLTIAASVTVESLLNAPMLSAVGPDDAWIQEGWRRLVRTLGLFVPFFITTAMFFQLYYLVPKPHPRKRSAFTGALIAGVLWEAAKQAFTYYATYVGHFDRYGPSGEGLDALGNTFGLIIAFVFWVYFSGVVLMLGAVVASLREHRHVTSGRLPGDRDGGDALASSPDAESPASEDAPSEATPGEAMRDEAKRDEAKRDEATPDEATSDEAIRDEAIRDEAIRDEAGRPDGAAGEPSADEAVSGERESDAAASGESGSGESGSGESGSDGAASDETHSDAESPPSVSPSMQPDAPESR